MSQFRVLAGVLKGGGSPFLRWRAGGLTWRYWAHPKRGCSSRTDPLPAVVSNSSYVEEMYLAWLDDHKNVHEVTMCSINCILSYTEKGRLNIPFHK